VEILRMGFVPRINQLHAHSPDYQSRQSSTLDHLLDYIDNSQIIQLAQLSSCPKHVVDAY
jgi:hypothetical protein